MRTIIQLPDDQLDALARYCRRERVSRAEAIRRAVRAFLDDQVPADEEEAFGIWSDRHVDPLEFEDRLRDEWDG